MVYVQLRSFLAVHLTITIPMAPKDAEIEEHHGETTQFDM